MMTRALFFALATMLLSSCYSFKGTSIPAEVKTFYVDQTSKGAGALLAPGDLPERFMEALRAKIRNQSRLSYSKVDPDISFESEITQFVLADEAASANNVSSLLKMQISIKVAYITADEDDNWTQTFSHTINYDPSVDLQSAQDGFIDQILEQITERIFNKAFTNW